MREKVGSPVAPTWFLPVGAFLRRQHKRTAIKVVGLSAAAAI
jgi:hypothetical protein